MAYRNLHRTFDFARAGPATWSPSTEAQAMLTFAITSFGRRQTSEIDPGDPLYNERQAYYTNVIAVLEDTKQAVMLMFTEQEVRGRMTRTARQIGQIFTTFTTRYPAAPEVQQQQHMLQTLQPHLRELRLQEPAPLNLVPLNLVPLNARALAEFIGPGLHFDYDVAITANMALENGFCTAMRVILKMLMQRIGAVLEINGGHNASYHAYTASLVASPAAGTIAALLRSFDFAYNSIKTKVAGATDVQRYLIVKTLAGSCCTMWMILTMELQRTLADAAIGAVAFEWGQKFHRVEERPEVLVREENGITTNPFGSIVEQSVL